MTELPPWVSLLGIALTLIFGVMAVYFYLKTRRVTRLSYAVNAASLVTEQVASIDGLRVTHHDKEVDNLSVARVWIENTGSTTIRWEDVAPKDPLRVVVMEPQHRTEFARLDIKPEIVSAPSSANEVVASLQNIAGEFDQDFVLADGRERGPAYAIELGFRYLAPGEHILLAMVHNVPGEDAVISLNGTLIGGRLKMLSGPERWYERKEGPFALATAIPVLMLALTAISIRPDTEKTIRYHLNQTVSDSLAESSHAVDWFPRFLFPSLPILVACLCAVALLSMPTLLFVRGSKRYRDFRNMP